MVYLTKEKTNKEVNRGKYIVCKHCKTRKYVDNYDKFKTYIIYCSCGQVRAYLEEDIFE